MRRNEGSSTIFKGVSVRFLFFLHGAFTFFIFKSNNDHYLYWLFIIPLVLLLIDIGVRYEVNYIWISAILYIASFLPIIWTVETQLLESRIQSLAINKTGTHHLATSKSPRTTPHKKNTGIYLLKISDEIVAKKLCEIGLVIGLIIGRALSPRRGMPHDDLSSLLLGFVANAADIIGVFDTMAHPSISVNRTVTYIVLACFSWSSYQFIFVPVKSKNKQEYDRGLNIEGNTTTSEFISEAEDKNNYGSTNIIIENSNETKNSLCNLDLLPYYILLFMHDGPFFILRTALIFLYDVTSEIHIFFTIKNTLVIILLLYRIISSCCCMKNDAKRKKKDGYTQF